MHGPNGMPVTSFDFGVIVFMFLLASAIILYCITGEETSTKIATSVLLAPLYIVIWFGSLAALLYFLWSAL